jgi:hypothetical protein
MASATKKADDANKQQSTEEAKKSGADTASAASTQQTVEGLPDRDLELGAWFLLRSDWEDGSEA